jgi:hypothetical protein
MKSKKFKVPVEDMGEIAQFINENALTVLVVGTDDGQVEAIILKVEYGPNERAEVHQLEDLIDDKWDEYEEEEEDED